MDTHKHLAGTILGIALLMGLLTDLILRGVPLGINGLMWTTAFLGSTVALHRLSGKKLEGDRFLILVVILGCSVLLIWRDSAVLTAMTVLLMMALTSTLFIEATASGLMNTNMFEYVHGFLVAALHSAAGVVSLCFGDLRTGDGGKARFGRIWQIGRGIGMSIPVVLLFGSLFAGADAVFDHVVKSALDFDLTYLIRHVLTIGFGTWIVGGFLRGKFLASHVRLPENVRPKSLSLGSVEVGVVLGMLNLLFALFVIVQIRYLFGGADVVNVTAGLTYAEYARRGFFELVTVAAFSLPLLLGTDWIVKGETPRERTVLRGLMGGQIILLVTVMASAMRRMLLYQSEYGLTESRIYATAFMAWIMIVFGWFALTVLRGKRSRFAFGALVAGVVVLVGLFAINPDDLIARTNLARALEGKRFDVRYVSGLGSDATPALVTSLASLSPNDRPIIAAALLDRNKRLTEFDWRSWNLSRIAAYQLVHDHEDTLRILVGATHNEEE